MTQRPTWPRNGMIVMEDIKEAISGLEYYQSWRAGADIDMPAPRDVTKWIDTALKVLKNDEYVRIKLTDLESILC